MADGRICITEARRACILVVDDQPLVAALIADLLALEGYEVETAKNGREALEKIAGRSYDLILSDLQMPELDGVGFYHELERQRPSLLPRLAFVSGSTEVPEYASFASGRPSHCWASLSPSMIFTDSLNAYSKTNDEASTPGNRVDVRRAHAPRAKEDRARR